METAWSAGLDLSQSNVESDPSRAGRINASGFLSTTHRFTRATTIGGIATASVVRDGSGLPVEESEFFSLTGNISHQFPIGLSRLQATVGRTFATTSFSEDYLLIWDHEWALSRENRLSHTLSWERRDEALDLSTRSAAAVTATRDLSDTFNASGTVAYVHADSEVSGASDNLNLIGSLSWQPFYDWQLSLTAIWDRNVSDALGSTSGSIDDRRVFLTLQYAHASGSPIVALGTASGQAGIGRITGRVFFDENNDGLWNPSERGARGVPVFLDSRVVRITDPQGTFEFYPVSAGEHLLTVSVADVPLPWGVLDETPRRFTIDAREDMVFDLPLVKLNQ